MGRKYFTSFLLDGRIPLSNKLWEIPVKPVAITGKNSLFSDSPEGAEASATVFSIINKLHIFDMELIFRVRSVFHRLLLKLIQ
jgi:transposase